MFCNKLLTLDLAEEHSFIVLNIVHGLKKVAMRKKSCPDFCCC